MPHLDIINKGDGRWLVRLCRETGVGVYGACFNLSQSLWF